MHTVYLDWSRLFVGSGRHRMVGIYVQFVFINVNIFAMQTGAQCPSQEHVDFTVEKTKGGM